MKLQCSIGYPRRMKTIALGVGFIAGIFFVVACERIGTPAAHAAPSDCTSWEYASATQVEVGSLTERMLPAGWEPFAVSDTSGVMVRRCRP